jgi:DNA-binding transcriptional regulator YiaG
LGANRTVENPTLSRTNPQTPRHSAAEGQVHDVLELKCLWYILRGKVCEKIKQIREAANVSQAVLELSMSVLSMLITRVAILQIASQELPARGKVLEVS